MCFLRVFGALFVCLVAFFVCLLRAFCVTGVRVLCVFCVVGRFLRVFRASGVRVLLRVLALSLWLLPSLEATSAHYRARLPRVAEATFGAGAPRMTTRVVAR